MSVSHPLLKELKGHIIDLRQCSAEIKDSHPTLHPFCQTLENIFREGLKATTNSAFGLTKRDYWHWIESLLHQKEQLRFPTSVYDAIQTAQECRKVRISQGKARLFLRVSLVKKLLKKTISCVLLNKSIIMSAYEVQGSVLADEILSEIFLSLLYEVDRIDFKLVIKNASFLDETWLMGIYRMYEFVPCKEMGITFGYVKGRAIVVKVEEGSVAGEDNQVEVGDVLDELYGHSLYGCRRGFIPSLAHKYQGLPVYLCIVKYQCYNGSIYPPLLEPLEKLGIRAELEQKIQTKEKSKEVKKKCELKVASQNMPVVEDMEESPAKPCVTGTQHQVIYLGGVSVGKEGMITEIDGAIVSLTRSQEKKSAVMDIGETRVAVKDNKTQEILVKKHFTEISSCGRKTCCPEYFAFIAGNTTCTLATEFWCHVFQASSSEECKLILCSIAHGFGRTHWEV